MTFLCIIDAKEENAREKLEYSSFLCRRCLSKR